MLASQECTFQHIGERDATRNARRNTTRYAMRYAARPAGGGLAGMSDESLVSALIGGGMIFCGLDRRSLFGLGVAAFGFHLLRSAVQGSCIDIPGMDDDVEDRLVKNQGHPIYSGGDDNSDPLEEAIMETFPASDPPALSGVRVSA